MTDANDLISRAAAIELVQEWIGDAVPRTAEKIVNAICALPAAPQPEVDPVAWVTRYGGTARLNLCAPDWKGDDEWSPAIALYAHHDLETTSALTSTPQSETIGILRARIEDLERQNADLRQEVARAVPSVQEAAND